MVRIKYNGGRKLFTYMNYDFSPGWAEVRDEDVSKLVDESNGTFTFYDAPEVKQVLPEQSAPIESTIVSEDNPGDEVDNDESTETPETETDTGASSDDIPADPEGEDTTSEETEETTENADKNPE